MVFTSWYGGAQSVDTDLSKVSFEISKFKISIVNGVIGGMQGEVDLGLGKIDVCIDPKTISTGIESRDSHLKGEDFFNVEKYPQICFVSDKITKVTGGYLAEGNLRLHGITKMVKIPLKKNLINGYTIVEGSFEVNRFDFELGINASAGQFKIGEMAKVTIICILK